MEPSEPHFFIENRTFDEIQIGETASLTSPLTWHDLEPFASLAGEISPERVDGEYLLSDMFQHVSAQGMWCVSLISLLLGASLPGPGATYARQSLQFHSPIHVGDALTITVTATAKDPKQRQITFALACVNQRGETVISGTALVLPPAQKVRRPRVEAPAGHPRPRGVLFQSLIARVRELIPLRMAVAHPVERNALLGSIEAARAGLIIPILIGPEQRIRSAADAEGLDLSPYTLIATEHSQAAAATAVAMARAGRVDAVMKGSLHTDELMHEAVAHDTGLTTDRRMSHVFVIDVPTYPRLALITDAALNIAPDLETKRDIVQNAIELAHALDIATPRVAILSAAETVNPAIRSTLDAAALCKMADRGQILGGVVDGPLAFDDAVSPEGAHAKGIISPVAGQADILVAPDLESGNMLTKQLEYFVGSQAAGIVLGGRVPIVLTSRADGPLEHVASCALALLIARKGVKQKVAR